MSRITGPGSWWGNPILDTHRAQAGLHWYLRQIEAALIHTLDAFGLVGERTRVSPACGTAGRKWPASGFT